MSLLTADDPAARSTKHWCILRTCSCLLRCPSSGGRKLQLQKVEQLGTGINYSNPLGSGFSLSLLVVLSVSNINISNFELFIKYILHEVHSRAFCTASVALRTCCRILQWRSCHQLSELCIALYRKAIHHPVCRCMRDRSTSEEFFQLEPARCNPQWRAYTQQQHQEHLPFDLQTVATERPSLILGCTNNDMATTARLREHCFRVHLKCAYYKHAALMM
jgi:hypothetical protein